MIPLKIEISCLDGYIIRNIMKKEAERLEKELPEMDEYSYECAVIDISRFKRIAEEFNNAILEWEKGNCPHLG